MQTPAERAAYLREYRKSNRKKITDQQRAWRAANRETLKEWATRYKVKHRERINTYGRAYYHAHKERVEITQRRYRADLRAQIIVAYGNVCACCGESHPEFLALDHINGGGNIERRKLKVGGGFNFYRYVLKQGCPDHYRLLCHNCNMAISFCGYCPHVKVSSDS